MTHPDVSRQTQPQCIGSHRRRDRTYGARAGNRTLNLGIKRLKTDRLSASQGVSGRLSRIRVMTQSSWFVSGCLTEPLGEAVNEAVKTELLFLSLIHISEPTRQAEISYAVFCLKK